MMAGPLPSTTVYVAVVNWIAGDSAMSLENSDVSPVVVFVAVALSTEPNGNGLGISEHRWSRCRLRPS